ncbi:MAG TPA: glycoside hydrolase family 13 protein [Anaerolineales bacterium]
MENRRNETISRVAARALRDGQLLHVSPPATPVSTQVQLELEAGDQAAPIIVFADPNREVGWRVAMDWISDRGLWMATILLPQEPTVVRYHFELADGTLIRERRQKEGIEKPLFGVWEEQDFRIAVYLPEGRPPKWVKGQVAYQIFPDRFNRTGNTPGRERTYQYETRHLPWNELPEHPPKGRDYYGGNLRGVIEKLDYLAGLGITCIYFTPIFESPTNHRYDATNYHLIDPELGMLKDFKELLEKARERGIRILLDGVFNHCSSESLYFKAAQTDPHSQFFRWFNFTHWPDQYVSWVGVKTMPEFVECPEVESFFFGNDSDGDPQFDGIAQYWLSFGTAGWRTDVTPWITDEYWRRFRRAVRQKYPEAFLVAEDWGDATARLLGNSFDATMNYRFAYTVVGFAGGHLNPLELDDRLETLRRDTPPEQFYAQLNLLDSHDTPRAFTLLKRSQRRMILAAALQLAYPGLPMIYYGDEAGIEGTYAENSRRSFPWNSPDKMLTDFYTCAIHARSQSEALRSGSVETAWIDSQGGYAFLRQFGEEIVLAVFNNGKKTLRATILLPDAASGTWVDLLGLLPPAQVEGNILHAALPPAGAAWYAKGSAE